MPNTQPTRKILGVEVEARINIGEIFTILTTFGAIAVMSFGIWKDLYDRTSENDKRIVVVEKTIDAMKIEADKDRVDIKDDLKEIKEAVKDVNKQLLENMATNAKNR